MVKRKTKTEVSDHFIDDGDEDDDADFVAEEKPKKPRKTPTKKAKQEQASSPPNDQSKQEDSSSPKKKRAPAAAKLTEPQTQPDGFVLHPPSLIYRVADSDPAERIAAFDLDGTLVVPDSGADFARSATDWRFINGKVKEVVQQFHKDGYKIVIFSNQGAVKSALAGKASENVRGRVSAIVQKLDVPVSAFMATQKDDMRKPEIGMWEFFVREGNGGKKPDLKDSFFVGDAAGREGDAVGDSDLQFARTIGLPFKTPDEVFGAPNSGGRGDATGVNAELANTFTALAAHYKGDVFKYRAFKNASMALEECETEITSEAQVKKMKIKGIGKGCQKLIGECLTTGKVAVLDPANMAAEAEAKAAAAETKATGDAFAFI